MDESALIKRLNQLKEILIKVKDPKSREAAITAFQQQRPANPTKSNNKSMRARVADLRQKQLVRRTRAGVTRPVDKQTEQQSKERSNQRELEGKLKNESFRNKALTANKIDAANQKGKKAKQALQNYNYDVAVDDEKNSPIETVGTKKRTDKYINQMSRRKSAGVNKLIDRQEKGKLKKTLKEKLEDFKKAMKQGGIGGAGSVKAGASLPSIKNMPKPGNASQAGKVGIPGVAAPSKVNPINSAEQTQNKDIKDMKMKEAQSAMGKRPIKLIKFAENGQWSLDKGNYDGYSEADNAKRKANNLTTQTGVAAMPRVKEYGAAGPSAAAKMAAQDKKASAKNEVKWTHKHPETGETTTVSMSPRKLKNYQKQMKALADEKASKS